MSDNHQALNDIYAEIAKAIDIPESMAEKARSSYLAVGNHLDKDPDLGGADVYTQGSFGLGTVIKPTSGEDEYDIDLVCLLPAMIEASARKIKLSVGKSLSRYRKELEPEGKRCWTFQYSTFHMDVLPCTFDRRTVTSEIAIRLTHKTAECTYEDRYSDPKLYQKWFIQRAGEPFAARRAARAKQISCSVEDVPVFEIKSPLQQAIQILKYHRNVMFGGDDNAPISIIITTLAALSYGGEEGVYDAISTILEKMSGFIQKHDGKYRIENPIDKDENFADKWNEEPEKAKAFYNWLRAAKQDLVEQPLSASGLDRLKELLARSMGERPCNAAFKAYGENMRCLRESGKLFASATGVSAVASPGARTVPNHSFFGSR